MINITTTNDATSVMTAITADINAVFVCVRGVAHMLVERLDYWLFSNRPHYQGMRQQPMSLIKLKPACCPVLSQSSGWPGNTQASAISAHSLGDCDR